MTPRVRALFDSIEEILLEGSQESVDVWALMTALRGPDIISPTEQKLTSTIPIRRKVFPRIAAMVDSVVWHPLQQKIGASFKGYNGPVPAMPVFPSLSASYNNHFWLHIRNAVSAALRDSTNETN